MTYVKSLELSRWLINGSHYFYLILLLIINKQLKAVVADATEIFYGEDDSILSWDYGYPSCHYKCCQGNCHSHTSITIWFKAEYYAP